MARGGNPNLTWTEDRLIVSAQRGRSSEWQNGELEDFAKLRSFLRGKFSDVGDDQIEEFLKTTNRVRTDYVLLLIRAKKGIYLTRTSLRKKYGMLRTTLMGFLNAMTDSFGPPWEVVRQIDCGGRPDESATTRAKYDSLDFDRFTEQLISLGVAIAKFESCLQGTAQDRTRPERYLIHELWSKWTELGFPQPR